MEKLKRIGILGGSFDPPTTAHLLLCAEALNILKIDEVWLVPCGKRNDKNNIGTPQ